MYKRQALFCEEFLHERRIIFANGAFFTPDGRVTDDLPLRGEIYVREIYDFDPAAFVRRFRYPKHAKKPFFVRGRRENNIKSV